MFMKVMGWLDRITEHIEEFLVGGTILFLAGLLIVHVLGRQFFGMGIPGQVELTQMSMVIITFAGIGYGVRKARHISMSAFYDQLSGTPRKTVLVSISLLTGALMFFLAWHALGYVTSVFNRGRTSSALQIPLWIPYAIAPIGLAMAGIQYWLTAIRNLTTPGIYRSYQDKEQYDEVPDDSDWRGTVADTKKREED